MNNPILLVVDSMFPLGPAHQVNCLVPELIRQDYDVHLAVLQDDPTERFAIPSHCHVHHLKIDSRNVLSWQKLRQLGKSVRPCLVHDWSGQKIVNAALGDLYPVVSSTIHLQEFARNDWGSDVKHAFDRWRKRQNASHIQIAHHPAVATRLESEKISASLLPTVGFPRQIDRAEARQKLLKEYKLKDNAILVGAYAPFYPTMRLKDLIWALDLITCIRKDVFLLLMGSGPQKNRLLRFLRCTEATGHLRMVGLPHNATEMMAGLDIYWESHLNWPNSNPMLMAMRLGTAVVGVLGDSTEQAIIHQTTGLGVNLGARDEFARWTKYLIEQPQSAAQLVKQAREHVITKFPVEPFVDGLLNAYQAVIGR